MHSEVKASSNSLGAAGAVAGGPRQLLFPSLCQSRLLGLCQRLCLAEPDGGPALLLLVLWDSEWLDVVLSLWRESLQLPKLLLSTSTLTSPLMSALPTSGWPPCGKPIAKVVVTTGIGVGEMGQYAPIEPPLGGEVTGGVLSPLCAAPVPPHSGSGL